MFSGLEFVVLIEVLVSSVLVFMYFSRSLSSADAGKRRVLLAASVAVMFMLVAVAAFFATQGYRVRVSFGPDKYGGMIDTHEHYWLGGNIAYFVEAMNRTGIDKAVFVPTGFKPDNKGYKENMAALLELRKMYPSRIVVFCTIDEQSPDAPEIFEDCMRKGGKGLKLLGWHPNYADEPVNSTKMYRVYEKARQLKAPILIHINLQDYPEWKPQFEQVLKDFGDVHFIAAHYCKATQTSAEL
ncbi:amidohydrolase family protein, partial [Candidatus Woesearchaeota archaeon]|nr:amidohydrolase family protein [Candidatus Woesearchaeota archaeon]